MSTASSRKRSKGDSGATRGGELIHHPEGLAWETKTKAVVILRREVAIEEGERAFRKLGIVIGQDISYCWPPSRADVGSPLADRALHHSLLDRKGCPAIACWSCGFAGACCNSSLARFDGTPARWQCSLETCQLVFWDAALVAFSID